MGIFNILKRSVVEPHKRAYEQTCYAVRNLGSEIKRRKDPHYKEWRYKREKEMEQDFAAVKKIWGFADDDIPKIKKSILFETCLWLIFATAGLASVGAGLHIGYLYVLTGVCLTGIGIPPALIDLWRYSVITNRQYVTFRDWIKGRSVPGGPS